MTSCHKFTHWVKIGANGKIRGYVEEYVPEDPRLSNAPFGMRLENGNFIWCPIERIERINERMN